MSIFKRDPGSAAEPQVTGTDVLRKTVHAWGMKPNGLQFMARDLQIALTDLEGFADGKRDLKVDHLKALAVHMYPHAEFDAERNLLRPAIKQEATGFILPPKFDAKSSPHHFPVTTEPQPGPQPVIPEPAKPKATARPGWAPW